MRKTIFIAILMIFTVGIMTAVAGNSGPKATAPVTTENKLSVEEINRLTSRVKEIRDMDKSKLTKAERLQLKNEVKEIKEAVKADGGYIYISGIALVLIILLVIILL